MRIVKIEVRCVSCGEDTREAIKQMDTAYGPVLARHLEELPTFSGFDDLSIFTSIMHPAAQLEPDNKRGSYYKLTRSYITSCRLEYRDWIKPDWEIRTQGYAASVKKAIGRIAKTRISETERQVLLHCADISAIEVLTSAPDLVVPLKPIWLVYYESSERPGIRFGDIPGMGDFAPPGVRYVEVKPEDAFLVAASMSAREESLPSIPRRFRRDEKGLHFYEAFLREDRVIEHEGLCGLGGENRFHHFELLGQAEKIVTNLMAEAKAKGYRSVPSSKQKRLIVEYPVMDHFADTDELDMRNALEEFLDDWTGRLGLGHCDGGSSGLGTMEVCCFVVDFKLAKAALEPILATSAFKDYSRIYCET